MKIKCVKGILIGLLLLVAVPVNAHQEAPTLETMLNDAGYILNRYEELATGIDCDTWNVTASLKRTCKNELKLIGGNVQSVKPVLGRAAKAKDPDLVDLFEVFQELNEIAGHLDELSRNLADFTDRDGIAYAQAGAKALTLAANLGSEIKILLVLQQAKLVHCGAGN